MLVKVGLALFPAKKKLIYLSTKFELLMPECFNVVRMCDRKITSVSGLIAVVPLAIFAQSV